jgi:hypothetical protein
LGLALSEIGMLEIAFVSASSTGQNRISTGEGAPGCSEPANFSGAPPSTILPVTVTRLTLSPQPAAARQATTTSKPDHVLNRETTVTSLAKEKPCLD